MCIKYRYHAICFNPSCDNVLGRKVRSSFCPEARKFHRLGCCAAGVVIETTRVRERFLHCDECKEQQQRASSRQPNVASAAAMAPGTRSRGQGARPNAGAAKKEKRDGTDLFDFVFANPVAEVNAGAGAKKEEEAEATGKGKGKKKGKATAQVIDKEEEVDNEVFVVRSPETAPRGRGRGRGRARGRARGSGRGRGRGRGGSRASAQTPASTTTTPQAAQGATEAREDAAEERLPYGFPAEGERQQRIAEQLYLYTWEPSDEE